MISRVPLDGDTYDSPCRSYDTFVVKGHGSRLVHYNYSGHLKLMIKYARKHPWGTYDSGVPYADEHIPVYLPDITSSNLGRFVLCGDVFYYGQLEDLGANHFF